MGFVGVAPGTTTLTLPDGTTVALSDWIDDKFYATVQFQNGDASIREAFSNGRSQPIPGGTRAATRVDTNVPKSGDNGLPKDWEMLVYGIGIMIVRVERPPSTSLANPNSNQPVLADGNGAPPSLSNPPILNTLFQMDRVIFFQYVYNSKVYSEGVIQDYPQGHGYYVFATTSAFELAQNGITSPRDRVAMVLPIHERENLGYKGIFQPEVPPQINQPASDGNQDAPLQFADVKTYKYGLIKRTVV